MQLILISPPDPTFPPLPTALKISLHVKRHAIGRLHPPIGDLAKGTQCVGDISSAALVHHP